MFGLVPYQRRGTGLQRRNRDFFDFDSFFENFFNDGLFPMFYNNNGQMRVDIKENDKEYIIEAELPGVKKEDITIETRDNMLTISVKSDETAEEKSENYIRRERRSTSMFRSFAIDNVKQDQIAAKHENGILKLTLPKQEKAKIKTRKIDIA